MQIASKIKVECAGEPEFPIPSELLRNLGISYEDAYSRAEAMASVAKALRQSDLFCKLPFCVTTEAQAMGAEVIFNENAPAPFIRTNRYPSLAELDSVPPMDITSGRIAEVLKAITLLTTEEEQVILNVEGPLTILGLLIGSRNLYRGLIKAPDKIQKLSGQIIDHLLVYLSEAVQCGAKLISYADPTVAYDVISDQLYQNVCGNITYNFLKRYKAAGIPCTIHLCNRTSVGFAASGFCTAEMITVPEGLTYAEALQFVTQHSAEPLLIGHGCLLQSGRKLKTNHIFQLRLLDKIGEIEYNSIECSGKSGENPAQFRYGEALSKSEC